MEFADGGYVSGPMVRYEPQGREVIITPDGRISCYYPPPFVDTGDTYGSARFKELLDHIDGS